MISEVFRVFLMDKNVEITNSKRYLQSLMPLFRRPSFVILHIAIFIHCHNLEKRNTTKNILIPNAINYYQSFDKTKNRKGSMSTSLNTQSHKKEKRKNVVTIYVTTNSWPNTDTGSITCHRQNFNILIDNKLKPCKGGIRLT